MLTNPYRQTKFHLSAQDISHFPDDTGREVAFVGKSNVGKSSVINALTNQSGLARTSKTPGRTQHVNFFTVETDIRLVDLPGYGFANVPAAVRKQWDIVINDYFNLRDSLAGLVLIMDIRRDLCEEDLKMLAWCQARNIHVHLLVNKSDKLPFGQKKQALLRLQHELAGQNVSIQLFSTLNGEGMDELLRTLNRWLYVEKNQAPA
jgi:GTP-binding protein